MGPSMVALVFGGMGVLMAGFAVVLFIKTRRFLATASRASAIVVEHEERSDQDSDGTRRTYYYPIIEFKDARGVLRRVTSSVGSRPKPYQDGAAVTALYEPEDPEKGKIESFTDLWLATSILSVTGAVFIAISWVTWR